MKKLLSIFLAGLLLLGLGTAASAAAGDAVNWEDFYIVTQPQAELTVPYGSDITLSVEVHVPEGARVVSYEWSPYSGPICAGTEPVLRLPPDDWFYPTAYRPYYSASGYYGCTITAVEVDADGTPVGEPRELTSQNARVTVLAERDMNFFERMEMGARNFFGNAFLYAYFGFMWLLAILMAPINFIKGLFPA
ncbi:MAG: hypothetical protein FWF60_09730 [Oscillospiraceae bacterium]|nr:hypothetical protein [Oscillospiraceae bacterium]